MLALLSDVHGNLPALEAVLADLDRLGIRRVACLGDIAFGGPWPREVVARLRERGEVCVRGNTEEALTGTGPLPGDERVLGLQEERRRFAWEALSPDDRAYLSSLPLTAEVQVAGAAVRVFHATPQDTHPSVMPWAPPDALAGQLEGTGALAAAYGHVHLAFVRCQRGRWVVNPGSVGLPFDGDARASYAILDADGEGRVSVCIRRVPYDVEETVRAARERGLPGWEQLARTWRTGLP